MWFYFLTLLYPLTAIFAFHYGYEAAYLLGMLVFVPILDLLIGRDAAPRAIDDIALSVKAAFYMPHVFLTLWAVALIAAGMRLALASPSELSLIILCAGFLGALASVHGHEFMHRDCQHSRRAADIAFAMLGYGHYTISHHLHHAKPGMQEFGSAPSRGTSVWRHLPVSIANGFSAAWRSEKRKNGMHPLHNRVIRQTLLAAGVAAGFGALWGIRGLILYVGQAMIAVFFIEVVGYIQHYGLRHNESDPFTLDLAWDSDYWLSNRLLINNPMHAMHHRKPMVAYTSLKPISAMLPSSYLILIWAALIPPLWFAVMDSRVDAVMVGTSVSTGSV